MVGEGAEEPGRSEGTPIAGERGTRRSEEARVSEKTVLLLLKEEERWKKSACLMFVVPCKYVHRRSQVFNP